ncbi:MAG: hypothetical protein AAFQ79_09895 [Pseudomonadota bacterium]
MFELIAFVILIGALVSSALSILISRLRRRSIEAAAKAEADYTRVLGDALADRKPVTVQRYALKPGDRLRLESPKAAQA